MSWQRMMFQADQAFFSYEMAQQTHIHPLSSRVRRPSLPDVLRSLRKPCAPGAHPTASAWHLTLEKDRMVGTYRQQSRGGGHALRAHGVLSEQGMSPSGTARQSAKLS